MTIIRYWNLKETIIWSYLVSRTLQEEKNSSDDTSDNSDCKLAESLWNGFKNELNLTQCKNIFSIFTVLIACVTVGIFMLMFGFLYYYYYMPPHVFAVSDGAYSDMLNSKHLLHFYSCVFYRIYAYCISIILMDVPKKYAMHLPQQLYLITLL